jgi:hypothetical protein
LPLTVGRGSVADRPLPLERRVDEGLWEDFEYFLDRCGSPCERNLDALKYVKLAPETEVKTRKRPNRIGVTYIRGRKNDSIRLSIRVKIAEELNAKQRTLVLWHELGHALLYAAHYDDELDLMNTALTEDHYVILEDRDTYLTRVFKRMKESNEHELECTHEGP